MWCVGQAMRLVSIVDCLFPEMWKCFALMFRDNHVVTVVWAAGCFCTSHTCVYITFYVYFCQYLNIQMTENAHPYIFPLLTVSPVAAQSPASPGPFSAHNPWTRPPEFTQVGGWSGGVVRGWRDKGRVVLLWDGLTHPLRVRHSDNLEAQGDRTCKPGPRLMCTEGRRRPNKANFSGFSPHKLKLWIDLALWGKVLLLKYSIKCIGNAIFVIIL